MGDGFVVVCDDDSIIFGKGATAKAAWEDAEEWIVDALRDMVSDHRLDPNPPKTFFLDLSWKAQPATKALIDSVDAMGGHDRWKARPDGTLDLALPCGEEEEPRCPVCHDTLDAHEGNQPCKSKESA